ncbi:hypothetical protein EON68_03320 [archaeon]|nr:MAG: hypothetical protein EON68_03320 [archaeon]
MERAGQAHASLQSLLPSLAPLPPLQSPERAALREFVLPIVDASTRPELPPDLLAAQRCPSCGWQYTPASVSANVWADDGSVHCLPRVPPCNLPMLHQTLNVVPSTLSSLREDAVVRVLTEPPVDGAAYCAAQGLDEARIAGVLGGHAAPASARSGLHSLAVELSHGPDLSSLVPTGVGFLPLTGIVFDEDMLLHEEVARSDTTSTIAGITLPLFQSPRAHPERPDRMRAIAQHLVATGLFERCKRIASRCCRRDELELVHAGEYLDRLQRLTADVQSRGGLYSLNSDTYANEHTQRAAELACGSTIALVEEIIRGRVDRGLAIVRPPGHHAEAGEAMGFCFFNNAAVAAAVATRVWGMQRVLIVDWDVHHGMSTRLHQPARVRGARALFTLTTVRPSTRHA